MKRLFLILLTFAFVPVAYGFGTGAEGCGGDCAACHSLKKEEAAAIVKGLDPTATVDSVGPAPVRGLFQLVVKKGSETGILYLDYSKKYLIAGRILDTKVKKDVTMEELEGLRRIDPARIPLDNALLLGNRDGARKLYVFTDPECPFCAKLHQVLVEMVREDPQLGVYIFLMPLDIHPDAAWKTESILCAAGESMAGALSLLDDSLSGKALKKKDCGGKYAEAGKKLGRDLGIGVTPTMVFPSGRVVTGARGKEEIRKLLQNEEKASVQTVGKK